MGKKITLIAPPRYEREEDSFLPQNLGLGYIASYLEKNGQDISIIDALAEGWHIRRFLKESGIFIRGLTIEEIVTRIPPDSEFIGITVPFSSSMKISTALATCIKIRYPKMVTVLGGISPSINPQEALSGNGVNYVVRGSGELPFFSLIMGNEPEKIKGLVFKKGLEIFDNGMAEITEDLDGLPFPARHLLPMHKYMKLSGRGIRGLRTASLLTSRGCPFDCDFCSIHHIYGYKWKRRSAINVLDEIKELIRDYSIEHIEFEDDNLTLDISRAEEIFDGLIDLNKVTWSTPNGIRTDTLNKQILAKMKKSGCSRLFLSIESGDPKMIKTMNKQLDLKKVEDVVKVCGKLGINSFGVFMVGYPGETTDSFSKTIDYIKRLKKIGLSGATAGIVKAYPGTRLRQICEEQDLLIDKERYTKGLPIGEYVDIKTKYFSEKEVYRRLNYINNRLNPLKFYADVFHVRKLIKQFLPQHLIDGLRKRYIR